MLSKQVMREANRACALYGRDEEGSVATFARLIREARTPENKAILWHIVESTDAVEGRALVEAALRGGIKRKKEAS